MRKKLVDIDALEVELFAEGPEESENNGERLTAAKKAMRFAIENELTQRQRECVKLYYFEKLTEDKVAERLGITKSTVSRHLLYARKKIERAVKYASLL